MTSRERVIAAIEYKNPDKMPVKLDAVAWPEMGAYLQYPNDIIHEPVGFYSEGCLPGRNMDNWGCEWNNLIAPMLGQVVGHPLADIDALDSYRPPNAADLDLQVAIDMAKNRQDKYFSLGYISVFERMINLRGFEDLLADILLEPETVIKMRDMVLAYNMDLIERLLALDPDAVYLADDWGSQISLLISPASWRELFLPAYQKMISRIKAAGKHVFFHTDGYVMEILPDLIEAGINAFWVEFGLNPIEGLREIAEGKAAYLALYDTQMVECASLDKLDAHVRDCMQVLGAGAGGFIARYDMDGSAHGEHILELYRTHVKKAAQ